MKLQSMTDFVLELMDSNSVENCKKIGIIKNYAKFLKQPLTLGMFVPVDEEGNVMEEVNKPLSPASDEEWDKWTEYQQAKERVLFEGFISGGGIAVAKSICQCLDNVEALTHEKIPLVDLTLTPNAIKQLGL